MKTTILERIYRRMLKEGAAPNVNGYGAAVVGNESTISTTIYDVPTLEDTLLDKASAGGIQKLDYFDTIEMISPAIIGFVRITRPKHPCWDAYQIAMAAGPGKIVYGCAYATSPSGLMISDRTDMSQDSISAWKNMSTKGSRDAKELDDANLPKDKRKTPDFTGDDCDLRREDFLNYAYASEGWEKTMLDSLVSEHKRFTQRMTKSDTSLTELLKQPEFDKHLTRAGNTFFNKKYVP